MLIETIHTREASLIAMCVDLSLMLDFFITTAIRPCTYLNHTIPLNLSNGLTVSFVALLFIMQNFIINP